MGITLAEQKEREEKILALIDQGLSVQEIAIEIGTRHDNVRKFLKRRGLKTKSQEQWEKEEKKRQRKKAREAKKNADSK